MRIRRLGVAGAGLLLAACTTGATADHTVPTRPSSVEFSLRPVLCYAPPYDGSRAGRGP